jgi:hypothetical protein
MMDRFDYPFYTKAYALILLLKDLWNKSLGVNEEKATYVPKNETQDNCLDCSANSFMSR